MKERLFIGNEFLMITFEKEPVWLVQEEGPRLYCSHISADSQYFGVGLANGQFMLRSPQTGRLSYTLVHSEDGFPVTSLKFNPADPKFMLVVSAEGLIREWSTKNSQSTWKHTENENQLYCCQYTNDGTKFLTGGSDFKLRVYDNIEKKLYCELGRNEFDLETTRGHCNRVFSIITHPTDPNIIFSGGWDNSLQVWDIRTQLSIRALIGPHVCGDSVDINGTMIMAGSWRTNNQLMFWDMRNFTLLNTMQWNITPEEPQCMINAAKFHPNGSYVIAGGSGVNQVKAFSTQNFIAIGTPLVFDSSILGISMMSDGTSMVVSTSDGSLFHHNVVVE